jgi:hypothetical protein
MADLSVAYALSVRAQLSLFGRERKASAMSAATDVIASVIPVRTSAST